MRISSGSNSVLINAKFVAASNCGKNLLGASGLGLEAPKKLALRTLQNKLDKL